MVLIFLTGSSSVALLDELELDVGSASGFSTLSTAFAISVAFSFGFRPRDERVDAFDVDAFAIKEFFRALLRVS
jgi:hypothetical protein